MVKVKVLKDLGVLRVVTGVVILGYMMMFAKGLMKAWSWRER